MKLTHLLSLTAGGIGFWCAFTEVERAAGAVHLGGVALSLGVAFIAMIGTTSLIRLGLRILKPSGGRSPGFEAALGWAWMALVAGWIILSGLIGIWLAHAMMYLGR